MRVATLDGKLLVSGSSCYGPGSRYGTATLGRLSSTGSSVAHPVPPAPARLSRPELCRGLSFVRGRVRVSDARRQVPHAGSRMSDRQIGWAVRGGRRVTALVAGHEVAGYVCGSDSYHWALVRPDGQVCLVHKSSTVVIGHDGDLDAEPEGVRARVELVVAPFRQSVLRDQFGRVEEEVVGVEH